MTVEDEPEAPEGTAARGLSRRLARVVASGRALWSRLGERHPKVVAVVRVGVATETIDRCFAVAAQLFITVLPLAIAIGAFLPPRLRDQVRDSVSKQLGIHGAAADDVAAFLQGRGSLREAIGVVGLLVALVSATSLTRRLQRMYERQWQLRPGRMRSSAVRWLVWILVWVAVLAVQAPLRSGSGARLIVGWVGSAVASVALWWWTPRLLLLRRVGWRRLLPTAVVTGLGQAAVGLGSRALMPTVTARSVAEYGPFGLVLSLMTWLLVVAGVIVVGAGVGRILAED